MNKTKDGHIKRIVQGIFIYWIVMIIVYLLTFWIKDSIPDTLVQVTMGGGVVELICTTVIEVFKKRYEVEE